MKETLWGYWLVVLGLFVIVVMMLLQNYTTTSQQDYYLLKEVTDAAMFEAIDLNHYRNYGEVRMIKEKFVENWMRRFAETININKTYNIRFYDIFEAPPKASVKITTATDTYSTMGDIGTMGVVNRLDAIIETIGTVSNPPPRPGTGTNCPTGSDVNCITLHYNHSPSDESFYNSWCKTGTGNAGSCPISQITSPARGGFRFMGWYESRIADSASCPTASRVNTNGITINGDRKLYACWQRATLN